MIPKILDSLYSTGGSLKCNFIPALQSTFILKILQKMFPSETKMCLFYGVIVIAFSVSDIKHADEAAGRQMVYRD